MPTYEYRCVSCEHEFERFQRMSDEPARECEVCGQPVKRLFSPVAVHFKGSGFYTTDYARKSHLSAVSSKGDCAGSDSAASSGNGNGDAPKTDSGTSSASESSKPASAPAAPATKIA